MRSRHLLLLLLAVLSPLAVAGQNSQQELNDQMWEAARQGEATAVTALLDKGADVNAKFRYGTTALFKAAERGHVDVVKVLLERGADATVRDTFYRANAMTWAINHNHVEVVRLLLARDTASVDDVLMSGVRGGKVALIEIALAQGGAKPETLTSALALTMVDKEQAAIAEMLRKAGAKPPLELDQATLQSYAGKYRPEQGAEIELTLQDGRLLATPTGQRAIGLMALDQTTFRPVAFAGIVITFNLEGDKVTGLTLKQGNNTTVFKKAE